MKLYAAPALLALLLAATASANVVRIPVARNSPGSTVSRRHHPRLSPRASFTESLVNNITGGGYYASVSVGTPGQDIDMILDTGSSDAFIVAAGADLCESPRLQQLYQTECGQTFDSTQSSTFEVVVPDGFQIQYLDGSTASGDYVTDHFEIGDTVIESLQMGLANQTASGIGVLGIGYTANEAAETLYPNLVDQMVAQDFIPTKAYSLYLNDYQSSTGSILFGGVDTEKFIGGLTVVPVLPDAQTQSFTSFTVGLTAVSYAFPNGTTGDASLQGGSLDAVLDSGTTLSYFPDSVATPLFEALGAFTYSSLGSVGLTLVECSLATSGLELTFRFNDSVSIVVPADEVVIDAIGGVVPPEIPLDQPCLFGIQNSGDSLPSEGARQIDFALLGDTFLRSAYVVYDLDNNEIALAQANLNSTDTNVQELIESSDLSSFEGVERQESSSGTSGGGGGGGGSSGTGSSDSGGSSGTSFVSGVASSSGFISASATSVASTTLRDTIRGSSASTASMEGVAAPTVTSTSATLGSTADSSPSGRPSHLTSVNKTLLSSSSGVQSVSATFTNGVIASSAASAGLFVANSGYGALYAAGLAALFTMSGSTLFWF